jgi:hypothetical protein
METCDAGDAVAVAHHGSLDWRRDPTDDPSQLPDLSREDETLCEWYMAPMEAPNPDVIDTLDRIADTTLNEGRSRASRDIQDVEASPLCDFCDHIFTHLKPIPPGSNVPRYIGRLWTPDRKAQSNVQFESSATELSCFFCRSRWNQLELSERESLAKNIREDDITLFHNSEPLHLKFKYSFADLPKTLLLAPCHGEVYKASKDLILN